MYEKVNKTYSRTEALRIIFLDWDERKVDRIVSNITTSCNFLLSSKNNKIEDLRVMDLVLGIKQEQESFFTK